MDRAKTGKNLLDTPVLSFLGERGVRLNLETVLYILLAALAIVACFTNLGVRTQSHDESLHALYSWKLYAGEGYEHNPMMHGPFLFHINALMYFLFGTSDFTARMSAALFGVILVMLPIFLRKELGRTGALIASALTLISPTTLYYARYIRNDVYMMVWAMLIAIALFRYMDSRQPKWIYLGAAAVTLAVVTKETSYITGFIGVTFLAILIAQQVFSLRAARRVYVLGAVALVVLALVLIAMNSYMGNLPSAQPDAEQAQGMTREQFKKFIEVVFLLAGVLTTMLLGSVLIRRDERLQPALKLLAAYTLAAGFLVVLCAAAGGLVWSAIAMLPEGIMPPTVFTILQMLGAGLAVAAGAWVWWLLLGHARQQGWLPASTEPGALAERGSRVGHEVAAGTGTGFQIKVLVIALTLSVVIFALLYTTFFTNPKGLGTGTFGAISYWLAQQEVKRAGQPWYYYLIIAPIYEFLPIGLGLVAMIYYFVTGKVDRPADRERAPSLPMVSFLVYWTLSAWLIYSWAGEKMPWLLVHVIQPMILLTGRFADDMLHGVNWREVWQKGGALLALLVPIILLAAGTILSLPFLGQAWRGMSLNDLGDTSKWLLALLVGGGLFYLATRIGKRLGTGTTWRVVFASVLVLLSLFTIRFAYMASFVNYDTAQEFLVYAHGTPDVKQTVDEIKEISRRLYGDEHVIKFAYSSDATWPFEWYFDTEFPNRVFFGRDPSRETTDVPVLVVGREEIAKTEPFLGKRYYRFDRKLVWWPHQDYYMGLSLAAPPEDKQQAGKNYFFIDMKDAETRREFWDILFYRKFKQSLADWQPSHPFAFYVRKDVAAQLWDYGVAPAAVNMGDAEDMYVKGQKSLTPVEVWGGQGVGEGQFNDPRNVAIGPDGSVYVADSGNHRIQKFTADGQFVTAWGHMCKMYEGNQGCQTADGAGGLYDPWGIAVDQDGFVYVADTWNHRIQKFTSDGEFVTMWGMHGVSDEASGAESLFWGPRAVAVDPEGQIYVSDTGNKRIQVFTPDGEFVGQWGGKGALDGRFHEPVGLAMAPDGTTFVADTWNQRIQVFDAGQTFLRKWDVDTWYGQSLQNKPYLALDGKMRLYATDPEGYRILVFDKSGTFLASLGQYGAEDDAFMLPTGIAIDKEGYIYVADTATHRVCKYAPLD